MTLDSLLTIEDHGSVALVRPLTDVMHDWLHLHTGDEAQWFGNALVVEPRFLECLIAGIREDFIL